MGLFDIFKKKKTKKIDELHKILDLIVKKELIFPDSKFETLKIDITQSVEFVEKANEAHDTLDKIRNSHPLLVGVIKGYHPYPGNALMAVVEWPVYEKSKKTYVTDCVLVSEKTDSKTILLPAPGSWIYFRELGEMTDEKDKINRNYAIAETHLSKELLNTIIKKNNLK